MRSRLTQLPVLVTALAMSCAGPEVQSDTPAPRSFPGFPPTALRTVPDVDASVYAEAAFQLNHEKLLGVDLTRDGLLPIRLTLGLRGAEQDSAAVRLDPDQLDMLLYLPNGMILAPVAPEIPAKLAGEKRRDQVRELTLEAGVLPKYEDARERTRFVFFALPKKHAIEGNLLTVDSGKHHEQLDVTKGLLAFNIMFENDLEPLHVGIGR